MSSLGFRLKNAVSLSSVLTSQGLEHGGPDVQILGVSSLDRTSSNYITFAHKFTSTPAAGSVILSGAKDVPPPPDCLVIPTENPRVVFMRMLNWLSENVGFVSVERGVVSESAIVHPSAIIEDGASVGERTTIGPNAVIRNCVSIGDDCEIGPGVCIGESGFGFHFSEGGPPIKFLHLGGVTIGNHVEIGPNSTIDRGTLSETVIGDYVKIDNLVHVAHNVRIEHHSMLAACAEVSGSVQIGEGVWVGPNASIINGIKIGKKSLVGIGAVVSRDVQDESVVFGNPAKFIRNVGSQG